METKAYKIYGRDGHRLAASFAPSTVFVTYNGDVIQVINSDMTGSNLYNIMVITSRDPDAALYAQIDDGMFENCKIGRIAELCEQ